VDEVWVDDVAEVEGEGGNKWDRDWDCGIRKDGLCVDLVRDEV